MSAFVPITSASRVPLYMACPAAAALPHAKSIGESMAFGVAGHEHMQMRATHGVDAAVAAIPDICRRHDLSEKLTSILTRRLTSFEWSPSSGSLAEVFLCMCRDGSVIRLDAPRGRYPKVPDGARLTATIDVMWSEEQPFAWQVDSAGDPVRPTVPQGSILWVVDYKFGRVDGATEDIESNRQLEVCALLAQRWTGASYVVPAVVYPDKGRGIWDVPPHPLAAQDMREIQDRVERMERSIWAQRKRVEDGEPVTPTEGPHCLYCPAQWRCPAKTTMIKAALDAPTPPGESPLSTEEASRAAEILPQLKRFVGRLEAALKAHVEANGPIVLSDGRQWGPSAHAKTMILPDVAECVIAEEFGPDAVKKVVRREVSRDAIEDAAREHLEARGIDRKVAPTVRRVYAKIGERGGMVSQSTIWWTAHRPTNGAPAPSTDGIEDL